MMASDQTMERESSMNTTLSKLDNLPDGEFSWEVKATRADVDLLEAEVRYLIEDSRLNQITYEATLSNDKYHFLGLDLAIHEPTAVARDFDEILNEAELEFEKLALSHDVAYEYGFDGQNFEFRR